MPKLTSNKYIRLLISAIFVGVGIYTIINFAFEILFCGIAIFVLFLKFKNPSPNSFLNHCTSFPFNDQTRDHSNIDTSAGYDIYINPTYNNIPGNIFNHDR